ncbi:hypothetical protein COCMIDRAFT_98402 [Bipolaris oryzae ATCC 44560]|uniref:NB-ARC domain-containing protein n=1 Tax=Bipolaris oryzae ATCC 44560 TaxID=930090 RepID=W6ZA05_COCMI|nr:uncharacterized protein COCMIDRAFT_98402 [Bipolaris oryzae ATCC 44560]EUC44359.1 hypothetical protein COCMIDRAFT_98402 [Bipolaris oryzae ATCC 44560]
MSPRNPPAQRESMRSSEVQILQDGSYFGNTIATDQAIVCQGNLFETPCSHHQGYSVATRHDFTGQFAYAALKPVEAFVPRSSLHDQIHTQLARAATDNSTKTLVVWGLGGAGKTQLVLDYCVRKYYRAEYKATFWIEAGRKGSLERDFVCLHQTLFGLHTFAGANSATTVSAENAVTGVKTWFAGQQERLLMVFDGADTIEDAEADGYIDIQHFIPSAPFLDVIITTRSSMASGRGVQVSEMEAEQAVKLFQKYARLPRLDETARGEVMRIVAELGCLALAVTLAATYVGLTPRLQSDITEYLPEYLQRRQELLERKPSLVHQYSASVLTTWETSYAAVASKCIGAEVLMAMLSFLSFDDIYPELFCPETEEGSVKQTDETGVNWRRLVSPQQPVTKYMIEDCFKELEKYSLVQRKAKHEAYVMHKLVHAWGYGRLATEEQVEYSQAAYGLVMEAIEGCGCAPDNKLRLVPHVMAYLAILLKQKGHIDKKAEMRKKVIKKLTEILGQENPHTIRAIESFAKTRKVQEDLEEEVEIQKEMLKIYKRNYGKTHPNTIGTMYHLTRLLRRQEHLEKEAERQKKVLEQQTQNSGKNHPCMIIAIHNLAATLSDQGCLEEAAGIQKLVLEKYMQMLGKDHPTTIVARKNLDITLNRQKSKR